MDGELYACQNCLGPKGCAESGKCLQAAKARNTIRVLRVLAARLEAEWEAAHPRPEGLDLASDKGTLSDTRQARPDAAEQAPGRVPGPLAKSCAGLGCYLVRTDDCPPGVCDDGCLVVNRAARERGLDRALSDLQQLELNERLPAGWTLEELGGQFPRVCVGSRAVRNARRQVRLAVFVERERFVVRCLPLPCTGGAVVARGSHITQDSDLQRACSDAVAWAEGI